MFIGGLGLLRGRASGTLMSRRRGGGRDTLTLEVSYQGADPATMLKVYSTEADAADLPNRGTVGSSFSRPGAQ